MTADGLLLVDKPEGPTSHDVVARVRRLLRVKRIGHTGTLDPMATGLLPLVVGRATRLAQFLAGERKRYTAGVRLGWSTATGDRLGEPIGPAQDVSAVTRGEIEAALARFRGTFQQTPPAFSAKKVAGVASYVLARRGEAAALAPVTVVVDGLDLVSLDGPELMLDVTCSAGFYVRSLAYDLGDALGCGAHLVSLRRTASGAFTLDRATPLAELEAAPEAAVGRMLPMSTLLADWPSVTLNAEGARRVRHGSLLTPHECTAWQAGAPEASGAPSVRVLDPDGSLVALAGWRAVEGAPALHPSVVLV